MSATVSTDEIAQQIIDLLTELSPSPDDDPPLWPWSLIAAHLPNGYWRRLEALDKLANAGRIVEVKVSGTPYVGLCDDLCKQANAAAERRGEPDLTLAV